MKHLIIAVFLFLSCQSPTTDSSQPPIPAEISDEELGVSGLPVTRAYWKVYKNDRDECYLIPRPDHPAAALEECELSTTESALLKKYDICSENPNVETINNILCEDAKAISLFLHSNLIFTLDGPFLEEGTKAEACTVSPCNTEPALQDFCSYYTKRNDAAKQGEPITDIARFDSDEEMGFAVQCANTLFGIQTTANP